MADWPVQLIGKKILVVGGTGFAGGYTALYLQDLGFDVTVMSRNPPRGASRLNSLQFLQGDYGSDDCRDGRLEGFDYLVFSACADIKYLPRDGSVTPEDFYYRCNALAIPRFFEAARTAGISRAVYLGSFYPQVAPECIESDPYVRSRHLADEAVRSQSCASFNVCSCNAPYILGFVPGFAVGHLSALANYASGAIANAPLFAPRGGTNHITCQSVAEALLGGLSRGESGKAYLLGDANLTWKQYFESWFDAAGNPQELEVMDEDHPIIPNMIMYAGVGALTSYQPPESEVRLLGYGQGRIPAMIKDAYRYYSGQSSA